MIRSLSMTSALITIFSISAFADNLPANNCQIFIRRLQSLPDSHGAAKLNVYVKVNWLGNDEHIQNVGFYSTSSDIDLGNDPGFCSWKPRPKGKWDIQYPSPPHYSSSTTEYGEYKFVFGIRSGSVSSSCKGYHYTSIGSFFVQTDKKTYWLNPDLDSNKFFYFDESGLNNIYNKGVNYYNNYSVFTDQEDMKYYNPKSCHR